MTKLWSASPYMTYKYYRFDDKERCMGCKVMNEYYILKHTTWFGSLIPIFPIKTNYFKVCADCGEIFGLEENIPDVKSSIKGIKPWGYNKFSVLDIENDKDDSDVHVAGTVNALKYEIDLHIDDIRKRDK